MTAQPIPGAPGLVVKVRPGHGIEGPVLRSLHSGDVLTVVRRHEHDANWYVRVGDNGNHTGPELLLSPYDLNEANFEVVSRPN